jgi:hypothetical protein
MFGVGRRSRWPIIGWPARGAASKKHNMRSDDNLGKRGRRRLPSWAGWVSFFGGLFAWTIGDTVVHVRLGSLVLESTGACVCLTGTVLVATSFWIAIGNQLRRIPQLNQEAQETANIGQPQSPPAADQLR